MGFFLQLTGPGYIRINGEKASAQFYVNEIVRKADDKTGNYILTMYEHELIKENGNWLFQKRTYYTIYQDSTSCTRLIQKLNK